MPIGAHQAYHTLFGSAPPWHAKQLLKRKRFVCHKPGKVEKALEVLFQKKTSYRKRRRILDEDWTPQEIPFHVVSKLWLYGEIQPLQIFRLYQAGCIRFNKLEEPDLHEMLLQASAA
jgi:hypothetical protein